MVSALSGFPFQSKCTNRNVFHLLITQPTPTPDLKGNLADLPSAQVINCVLGNPLGLKTLSLAQTRQPSRDHKKAENI